MRIYKVERWPADNGIGGHSELVGYYETERLADLVIANLKATGTWDSFHKYPIDVVGSSDHATVLDVLKHEIADHAKRAEIKAAVKEARAARHAAEDEINGLKREK